MINLLINRNTLSGKIGNLILDATLRESHDFVNEVTRYPVEDGSNVTDHIKINPETVTIVGFISNSPIPDALHSLSDARFSLSNLILGSEQYDRVTTAFYELLGYMGRSWTSTKPREIDIITGLHVYPSMTLSRLRINRSRREGDSIEFTAEFIKIKRSLSKDIKIEKVREDIKSQAQNKVDVGKVSTEDAKQKPKSMSILSKLGHIVEEKIAQ